MLNFLAFMIVMHGLQYWVWREYVSVYKSVWYQEFPENRFESMLFWPQFLGILKGPEPL